ncbi:MAG: hypothetical protein M3371_02980 [Acidobacteriota bacterium]|nr:hypothetical protein [Acidobacteriota bacterium]
MRTQTIICGDAADRLIDEEDREIRLFVIYASSQTVGLDGAPLQQIPLDLVEDDADGGAVARAMIEAAGVFTDEDGWIIERVDADSVPTNDMARLAERLSHTADEWDEFVCLPEGTCTACGGAGVISMDCCDAGIPYTLLGDCEGCDGTGKL